jgi:type IV fimbrial biogenesis protein FimT
MKPNCNHRGFTLIELIVTVAMAAIIMSQAVPAFRNMAANNRITSQLNELVTAINLGRSEAIKRNVRVVLCRSANPTASSPSCGGTANTWTTGWLLFASGDSNNTYQAGTDTLIRVGDAARTGIQIRTNSTSNHNLEINSNGSTNENGGTAVFAVCDDRNGDGDYDEQWGKQIQVTPTGHVQLIISPIPNCQTPSVA